MHARRRISIEGAFRDFDVDSPLRILLERADGGEYLLHESAASKLGRGNIDGNSHRRQAGLPPRLAVGGSPFERPSADFRHEASGLQDRQESPRRHQSVVRVLPAQECFGATDPARVDVQLGLVVQDELIALQRRAQPIFHPDAFGERRVHFQAVVEVLLAGGLGFLQGRLGVLHQLIGLAAVLRIAGDTAFDGDGDFASVDDEWGVEQLQDALVEAVQLVLGVLSQCGDGNERTAAQMRQPIRVGTVGLQPVGDHLQKPVACVPAEGVVDHTQVIDVEDLDGELRQALGSTNQQPAQAFAEQRPLGQSRQRIEIGEEVGGILAVQVLQRE